MPNNREAVVAAPAPERYLIAVDGGAIEYEVVRSQKRRRTVEIRVDPPNRVLVHAPLRTSKSMLATIVTRRAKWIARQIAKHAAVATRAPRHYVTGERIRYLGNDLTLRSHIGAGHFGAGRSKKPSARLGKDALEITLPPGMSAEECSEAASRAVEAWYRERALAEISRRVKLWAERMDVRPAGVRVRDQKTRWGSCGPTGLLHFNWRLIMAPPAVVDYVVVHELAHIRHPHHRPAFWRCVGRYVPDWQEQRRVLHREGPEYREV